MANIKNFGIVGVGTDVQYGKGGVRFINNAGTFQARDATNTGYVTVQGATPVLGDDLVTLDYLNTFITGGVHYKGTIDASLIPAAQTPPIIAPTAGDLYRVATAGNVFVTGVDAEVGDFFIYNGTTWDLIKGTTESVIGTANRISVTEATPGVFTVNIDAAYAGQASITTLGTVTTGTWNGSTVAAGFGGTGQTTYDIGDLLVGNDVAGLDKLVVGTDGQVLTVVGGTPVWSDAAAVNTFGDGLVDTAGFVSVALSAGTVLSIDGASPNGTLGLTGGTAGQVLLSTGAGQATFGAVDLTGVGVTGSLGVTNGGTGLTAVTDQDLLIGGAGNTIDTLGVGTDGQTLTVVGGAVTWATPATANAYATIVGDTGTTTASGEDTLSVVGGTGITTTVTADNLAIDLDIAGLSAGAAVTATDVFAADQGTGPVKLTAAQIATYVNSTVSTVGSVQSRTVAFTTSTVNIGALVTGRVTKVKVQVLTPYSAGTISIGDGVSATSLAATTDIDEANAGIYVIETNVNYAVAAQLIATLTGATGGSGFVIIEYIQG